MEKKYGNYVISLDFDKNRTGLYRQVTSYNGKLFGLDFHVEYGTYLAAGKMGTEPVAHAHEYNQVLVFMGTDADCIGDLGAEVEMCLGPQCEKHIVTTSTAISIPKGLPHFPATINRMDRRFIYMEVSCTSEPKETPVELSKESMTSAPVADRGSEYGDNIVNMSFVRKGAWSYGPRNRDDSGGHLAIVTNPNSFDYAVLHETLRKAPYRFGPIPDKPHVHSDLEILTFMGTDTDDLSELGGEVEVSLGKEAERHVITRPSAIVIPGMFPHCPVIVTKVDKPFFLTDVRPFGTNLPKPKKS
ncbi:MAG: hypothetical protein JXA46_10175 [Dehalococcoidales bacterium]|nr:hypothetical protein [Dehalococcoidales bacterium]